MAEPTYEEMKARLKEMENHAWEPEPPRWIQRYAGFAD